MATVNAAKNVDSRRGVSKRGGASLNSQMVPAERTASMQLVKYRDNTSAGGHPVGSWTTKWTGRTGSKHQPPPPRWHQEEDRRHDGVRWPDDRRRGRRDAQQQAENAAEVITGAHAEGDPEKQKWSSGRGLLPVGDSVHAYGPTSS